MTQPTRFGRIPRQKIFFDEREVLNPSEKQEKDEKSHVQVLETQAASPHAPPVVHELVDRLQIDYTPPIQVQNDPFEVLCNERDPLSLFMRFFGGFECLGLVCE